MTKQHSSITDPQIHEPKNVSTAAVDTAYIADGSGSGTWKKVDSLSISGLSGDSGSSNKKLITNGSDGFVMRTDAAYGAMCLTNNGNAFAVTAAGDSTLQTTTDYALFTGVGAPWAGENQFGVAFDGTNKLTVPVTGVYAFTLFANIGSFPNTAAFIGARLKTNGTTFASRITLVKSNAAGDQGQLVATELVALTASDYVQLYLASTHTGNLTVRNCAFTLNLIRQTA